MTAAAGGARRFPWDETIAIGLGLLRLSPRDFWAMTPRELAHAMRFLTGGGAGAPPSRSELHALMKTFPDL